MLAAFAADPSLEDLTKSHRYNGACSATLAGCGKGEDAELDETARREHREQALVWLHADLHAMGSEVGEALLDQATLKHLRFSLCDLDLAGIRDDEELAKLPADEQEACRGLWSDTKALIEELEESPKE